MYVCVLPDIVSKEESNKTPAPPPWGLRAEAKEDEKKRDQEIGTNSKGRKERKGMEKERKPSRGIKKEGKLNTKREEACIQKGMHEWKQRNGNKI